MISNPISMSIARSISMAINEADGGFNPLSLFAAGEHGVWYDPSDLSTLFQDVAGTIPVTAAGQPVGLMRDKSGRGNHASQATATSRPVLQTSGGLWYLAFDGVDDWMVRAGNVDFSATDKMSIWAGQARLSDVNNALLVEFSSNNNNFNGTFAIAALNNPEAKAYESASRGTTKTICMSKRLPAPHTAVICATSDIAAPKATLRVNGVESATSTATQGTGNYGSYPLYIGGRGGTTFPLNGNLYGLIVRGVKSTDAEIAQTEAWMNNKTGAY